LNLALNKTRLIKTTAGKIAVAAVFLFALMGAGKEKESVIVNIFGNKGQVDASVVVSGHRIGKMKKDGDARSLFIGHIIPGEHVVKLTGSGAELWSQEITAYEGMEYFLDSSEGQKFTPPAYDENESAAAVKKNTAPAVNIATTPVVQAVVEPEVSLSSLFGKLLKAFQKQPDVSLINTPSPAVVQGAPESKPVASPVKKTKIPQKVPTSVPAKYTYVPERKAAYKPQAVPSSPAGTQTYVPENKPVPTPVKPTYVPEPRPVSTPVKPTYVPEPRPVPTPVKPAYVPEPKPVPTPVKQVYVPEPKPVPAPAKPIYVSEPKPMPAAAQNVQDVSGGIRWMYSPDQVFKLAKSRKKPVMMDFYTDTNGQCKKLDSEVYTNKEIIDLSEKFVAVKINGEKYPNEASRYKVGGYPTVIFLSSGGTEKARMNGYYDSSEFYKIMSKAAK
jgi:thiol-disulfide isomerase/thioredoxin